MAFKKPENIDGLISNEDGKFLEDYAGAVPEGMCIVEIGPFTGKSTAFMGRGCAANNTFIYTYDLWEKNKRPISGSGKKIVQTRDESFFLFTDNMKKSGLNSRVFPLNVDSVQGATEWPEDAAPIGLMYIDGDHRYPGVKADIEAWLPKVAGGAPIIFDDYYSNRGVKQAVDEWCSTTDWQIVDHTERFVVLQEDTE